MSRTFLDPGVVEAELYSHVGYDRVRCEICPRHCTLHDNQRGYCFVRMARDGRLTLTSYGRSSGFCIDPIEKKPLFHFYPGSATLSFGTAGCNLGCRFCQNWDISKARDAASTAEKATPEDIAHAAVESGCVSVSFTYNDPVIFYEYALDTAEACAALGIRTVVVSAGYMSDKARERFFAPMTAANIDLKAFTSSFYRKNCLASIEPVKETLLYLRHHTRVWLEITTLLIPGENDSEAEIAELCQWVGQALGSDVPLHFTAFHPAFKMTNRRPTPCATVQRARGQALREGLHFVYTGNSDDPEGQATVCARCGHTLIARSGYDLRQWALDTNGCCAACGTALPGHFAPTPQSFGSRRLPVRIRGSR